MPDTLSLDMQWLLDIIQGTRWPYSPGLVTHDLPDPHHQDLHQACLELERQGYLVREELGGSAIAWMPAPPVPKESV